MHRILPLLLLLAAGAGLAACDRTAPPAAADAGAEGVTAGIVGDRLSVLRESDVPGFAVADTPRRFGFPQDHGPHPAYRHEWWYLTGHLRAADGQTFGFELTFFRLGLVAPAAADAAPGGSAWRARQLYAAHFAITDVGARHFFSAARYSRDALGLGSAQAQPFAVHVADWSLVQASVPTDWLLSAADEDYGLQLQLRMAGPPVLNGDAGLSRKADAPGAASYYYSMPRLQVSGRLRRGTATVPVSGLAWLDREWGSGSLGRRQQGWDWFALQLGDGSTLMFYALRDDDGRRDAHSAGTFVDASGHVTALGDDDVDIQVLRHWRSPRGGEYPAQWRLTVHSLALQLQLTPQLADQELPTQPRYWEGAVEAVGRRGDRPVTAQGYVELVGYAHSQARAMVPSATAPPAH